MSTPNLDRRVRRLENDVQAIYEMLATITATQQRQGNRLDEIDTKLDNLAEVQQRQSAQLDSQATQLDGQANQLARIIELLDRS